MLRIPLTENAEPSICLSDAGIVNEISDEQPTKTFDSIRLSFDSDSKMTSPRDPQNAKHSEQRISTHFGIHIEDSDEQNAKPFDSIRQTFDSFPNRIVEIE
jgi:hypothetical protein